MIALFGSRLWLGGTIISLTGLVCLQASSGRGAWTSARTLSVERAQPSGEQLAAVVCAACHKVPPPDALPKRAWRDQIARMWLIVQGQPEPVQQGAAARTVSLPPEWETIARHYESAAPAEFAPLAAWPAPDTQLRFRRRSATPPDGSPTPAVSNVRLVDMDGDKRLEVVAGDMRNGVIVAGRPYETNMTLREITDIPHPAHIEPVDLDRDGVLDFLVGDLGAFMPSDSDLGSVVWLRGRRDGSFGQMSLDGWPPVADVEPADFDGDGKLDLAVAAFGWRRTGALTVLRNDTTNYDKPGFFPVKVEERTGAIHAPAVDLNGDSRPDLVVLFSQQHESVIAFLNSGPGIQFERQVIYEAPHPAWGSSGIQVVDLDRDGDLDVLMTNGDSFELTMRKPYHGIVWLENRGTYPFVAHTLAQIAGVHRAQAAD